MTQTPARPTAPSFDLDRAIIDDPEAGVFRANRAIFTDEELFELEMKHIFEGNWVYLVARQT